MNGATPREDVATIKVVDADGAEVMQSALPTSSQPLAPSPAGLRRDFTLSLTPFPLSLTFRRRHAGL